MDSLQRKGINFDLNTQALKEYYPKGDWHNAYADVRDFFEANGFEHIQGSGYHSVEAMSDYKRISMAQLLCECVYHIRCTGTV